MYGIYRSIDKLKRAVSSAFTSRCICCGNAAAGGCLCSDCKNSLSPAKPEPSGEDFYFSRSAAKYVYSGAAKAVLLRFKFSDNYRDCADTVFGWLLSAFEENFSMEDIDCIIPVPTFDCEKTRLSLLAKRLSLYAEVPYSPSLLKKTRKTEKQHKLSMVSRRTNLAGAFSAGPEAGGKRVLLVDDVFTTGSTVNECSKALRAAGASEVFVLTVLKTNFIGQGPLP